MKNGAYKNQRAWMDRSPFQGHTRCTPNLLYIYYHRNRWNIRKKITLSYMFLTPCWFLTAADLLPTQIPLVPYPSLTYWRQMTAGNDPSNQEATMLPSDSQCWKLKEWISRQFTTWFVDYWQKYCMGVHFGKLYTIEHFGICRINPCGTGSGWVYMVNIMAADALVKNITRASTAMILHILVKSFTVKNCDTNI